MLGCTCQAVRGFPTFAPCLEHVCAGGDSVSNMGFVSLYRWGLWSTPYNYVTCKNVMGRRVVMVAHGAMYDIRHPRQEDAI